MIYIYGNIYHQYTPAMLAYIPAPWILWVYIYIYKFTVVGWGILEISVEPWHDGVGRWESSNQCGGQGQVHINQWNQGSCLKWHERKANHRGLKWWNPAKHGESTNMSKFINPHVHVHEEAWRSMISRNWGSQLLKQVWGKWLPNTPWGLIRMTDRFATDSCDFSIEHQLPTGITPKGCIVAPSEGENFTKWFQRQDGRPRSHGVADSCHDEMNHPWCIMILHNALNPKTIKHRRNHHFMDCIIGVFFALPHYTKSSCLSYQITLHI